MKTLLRAYWDRVGAGALVAAGALALALGWIGVSATPLPAEQIPYIVSGGLVGLSLIGIGATLWLSADLRDEWRVLHRIERRLDALEPVVPAAAGIEPTELEPVEAVELSPEPAPRPRRPLVARPVEASS